MAQDELEEWLLVYVKLQLQVVKIWSSTRCCWIFEESTFILTKQEATNLIGKQILNIIQCWCLNAATLYQMYIFEYVVTVLTHAFVKVSAWVGDQHRRENSEWSVMYNIQLREIARQFVSGLLLQDGWKWGSCFWNIPIRKEHGYKMKTKWIRN